MTVTGAKARQPAAQCCDPEAHAPSLTISGAIKARSSSPLSSRQLLSRASGSVCNTLRVCAQTHQIVRSRWCKSHLAAAHGMSRWKPCGKRQTYTEALDPHRARLPSPCAGETIRELRHSQSSFSAGATPRRSLSLRLPLWVLAPSQWAQQQARGQALARAQLQARALVQLLLASAPTSLTQ